MMHMHRSSGNRPRLGRLRSILGALVAALLVATTLVVAAPDDSAQAADLSRFDAGNIISDEVFFNSGTMTEAQIQTFLNSKVPSCKSGYTCLKSFKQNTTSRASDAMCKGYAGASNESAARIILKVAKSCGVNPQAIIVMLQKEQGLVQSSAPSSWAWKASMGYACPDTAACDTRYYGFYNQVFMGVWQLKRYGNPPGTSQYFTWYPIGKSSPVRFHPNAACGSSNVVVKNKATAALYYYTPYQPNSASLAAGYGAANNSCASYGNRNFYNYFTDWFGGGSAADSVRGSVDGIEATDYDTVRVRGWAFDSRTSTPVQIRITADGSTVGTVTASTERKDVGAAYPGVGNNRGFDATVKVSAGERRVCATILAKGVTEEITCKTVTVESGSPRGRIDSITAVPGAVRVTGWALDVETKDPIRVHVYVNGSGRAYTASVPREDIGRHYPSLGPNHGYDVKIAVPSGSTEVCVYGINVGKGSNTKFGCSTVSVLAGDPRGSVDTLKAVPGGISVSGWAFDPDTADPSSVHVYIDSKGYALTANQTRTDIGRKFPVYGPNHGFARTFSVADGAHKVCVYAINTVDPGARKTLRCETVTVRAGSPFGRFDTATVSAGSVAVTGWAIDPDVVTPISVHVYVDGVGVAMTANTERPDIGRKYAAYGSTHGFSRTIVLPPSTSSTSRVCAYAINVATGSNTALGCKTVTR
jgi:hypothetical protein